MRRPLLWIGVILIGLGAAVILASVVMTYLGINASYNLGDPMKFEFVLIPFWLIGLAVAALGALCLLASRGRKNTA